MKVKIAELKTHLSKYVQSVREGGEPIEVCVREQTVAYLTKVEEHRPSPAAVERDLAERLQRKGLLLVKRGQPSTRRLEPGLPGDGKNPVNSVVAMRKEKEW